MITVSISGQTRALKDVEERWIAQEVQARRKAGLPICVMVAIKKPPVDVVLTTPACGGGGGGFRLPTAEETRIFELWRRHHLQENSWSPGDVIAFLKQVQHAA